MSEPLRQLTDTLCRGFCGWNLRHDQHALTRLGSGRLDIDLVKRTCQFECDYVPRLWIVDELTRHLNYHMEAIEVSSETIRSATLSINLTIGERENQKDKSVMWFGEHHGFVGCEMEIRCTIGTEEESCKSEHRAYAEWPREGGA